MRLLMDASRQTLALLYAVISLSSALHAAEKCSAEVKLLLSPPTIQTVIASLGFERETTNQVYFFDDDELDLFKQGVILRVRVGETNDLTVKVRVPEGKQVDATQLREHFPCETNRTGAGEDRDYSVQQKHQFLQLPELGSDIAKFLNPAQKRLLQEAHAAIDWSRVKRIVSVKATKWETRSQSPFPKLTLELWESPAGNILEISTKVARDRGPSKYGELKRLVEMKSLSLNDNQGNKTSMVLGTLTHKVFPPR